MKTKKKQDEEECADEKIKSKNLDKDGEKMKAKIPHTAAVQPEKKENKRKKGC